MGEGGASQGEEGRAPDPRAPPLPIPMLMALIVQHYIALTTTYQRIATATTINVMLLGQVYHVGPPVPTV